MSSDQDDSDKKLLLEKLQRELFVAQLRDKFGERESDRLWREFMKAINGDYDE